MKPHCTFYMLLCAVVLGGGYTGHRLRRGTMREAAKPSPEILRISPLVSRSSDTPITPQTSPVTTSRWTQSAAEVAGNAHADLAIDAPHLFLALAGWNVQQLAAVMADAQRLPDGPVRKRLEEWILAQLTERAPVAAMAWTREHRPDQYPAAVLALGLRDASAAWQAVMENPLPEHDAGDTLTTIFSQWAAQDRLAALDALMKMDRKDGGLSFSAGLGFVENALPPKAKDPEAWAAARNALTQRIMQEKDPDLRSAGIDLLKHAQERQMSNTPPAIRREELTAWLGSLQLGEKDLTTHLIMVAQHDGCTAPQAKEAWPWLWNTVPESQRGPTLTSIVEYWASDKPWSAKDPNACGQWLNTQMPLGPEYGAAIKDFALHAATLDPVSGLAWAEANPDPVTKGKALLEVHALIRQHWSHRMVELNVPTQ